MKFISPTNDFYVRVIEKRIENFHGSGQGPVTLQTGHDSLFVGVRHYPVIRRNFGSD